MRVQAFPVLGEDDRPVIDRLAGGLGETSATVLSYLLLRNEEFSAEAASLLAIRVGTGLNRKAVRDALSRLEDRELVETTTVRDETPGRPPTVWRTPRDRQDTVESVYEGHARGLVSRARRFTDSDMSTSAAAVASEYPTNADVSLALNWRPNGLHAPLFVAEERGAYEERGLSLRFDANRGSRDALDALRSDDADIAVSGAATVLRARANGEPVVPVALLFQHAMTALYGLESAFDGPFERVDQLRGLRIGTPPTSETDLLGRLFLSQADVLTDVELVELRGEERDALLSGTVDVVTGSFSDPRQLRSDGIPVESILVAEQFPLPGPALVTTARNLSERESELVAFLAGTTEGWTAARTNPTRVRDAIEERKVKARDVEGDGVERRADRERHTFEEAVSEFGVTDTVRKGGWGRNRMEAWDRLKTALEQVGLLSPDEVER
ncbi:ABC transporter substrate-binding protein [Haladaptatus sp. DYF46]|uniref:ABC transporter substrate-binding protein n=1 Tax=Haladaptatus sp. DYF46 TaxID=2886041 RepID=UPI001E4EE802|nr:ABC transporter substrate-binding protein [Haladaptatus sp. DYF46]